YTSSISISSLFNAPSPSKIHPLSLHDALPIFKELKRPENTFQSVANTFHMSPSSVSNIFDKHIQVGRLPLSDCICFDEVYAFHRDRKSTRLNSSHVSISYAVFCLKKKIVY